MLWYNVTVQQCLLSFLLILIELQYQRRANGDQRNYYSHVLHWCYFISLVLFCGPHIFWGKIS